MPNTIDHFKKIRIKNFKALKDVSLDLHETCTVIVGSNGSGKSSVLQAIHWVLQSARNPKVEPKTDSGSTLPERMALYMPTPEFKRAAHFQEYGNKKHTPQLDLDVTTVMSDDTTEVASFWLKSARNEGLSVGAPPGNRITSEVRNPNSEISAYIPGLAGISLSEEKRTKLVVQRQAAAGDANTILRNLLVLLEESDDSGFGLNRVSDYVSRVLGDFRLVTTFDEDRHTNILCEFQFGDASKHGESIPLEMAGIGFLQVIQIFTYLVYFQPKLLLVDEPDAHLYPLHQESLVTTLIDAAKEFDTQLILTTHSPSIVRALGERGSVVWMENGEVHPRGNTVGRSLMGWGLLDRKVVLVTEDGDTNMLRKILEQWDHLERLVAVWPVHGSDGVPNASATSAFENLVGGGIKILVHRDRDFLMPDEVTRISDKYTRKGIAYWTTKYSDIESYWLTPEVLAQHLDITLPQAEDLLRASADKSRTQKDSLEKFKKKREHAEEKYNRKGQHETYTFDEAILEARKHGGHFDVLGKILLSTVRDEARQRGYDNASSLGKMAPSGIEIATDLKTMIESLL